MSSKEDGEVKPECLDRSEEEGVKGISDIFVVKRSAFLGSVCHLKGRKWSLDPCE